MNSTENWRGRLALMISHCAGMLDMIALPIWIGAMITAYKFNPQEAGGLVTIFFIAAVISSMFSASRFNRVNPRLVATIGFAASAVAFGVASAQTSFLYFALTHVIAGLAVGAALSVAHGTIGRSTNPHRLWAIVNTAACVFAFSFMGITPVVVEMFGGTTLFYIFSGIMMLAAVVAALLFPQAIERKLPRTAEALPKLGRTVWAGILGISLMGVTQAMVFSFVQQIGIDRGYGVHAVTSVLIALGFVNIFPAPLAAILEKKLFAERIIIIGPVVQAAIALLITSGMSFISYAVGAVLFSGAIIFTHTFVFGLLSRLDTSGRAVAATPAILMAGSAIGPFVSGTLVTMFGYPAIGIAAVIVAFGAILCFGQFQITGIKFDPVTDR